MHDLIEKRLRVARQLYKGECGGTYQDAVLILVSIISAMATKLWPGRDQIDRKRFVEVVMKYSDVNLKIQSISVPLLLQYLKDKNEKAYDILRSQKDNTRYFGSSRVIEGKDIDKTEEEIIRICSDISKKDIRKHSYSSVLYSEVRSGLVHEYNVTKNSSIRPMHDFCASVSYINIASLSYVDVASFPPLEIYHAIHFHYEWIEKLVMSLQKNLGDLLTNGSIDKPPIWWIDEK